VKYVVEEGVGRTAQVCRLRAPKTPRRSPRQAFGGNRAFPRHCGKQPQTNTSTSRPNYSFELSTEWGQVRINSFNFGFASEAFLQRGFIDYSIYGPGLAHLDGRIIQGNNSYFLWGMAPERYPDPGSPELELNIADLYQVGSIPASANSIVFKYRNDWPELFVGGVSTPLVEIMPGVLSGSVQSVKGTEAEIRFRANPEKYVMFDAISFSTRVVPEPTSSLLFLLSAAGLSCRRARKKVSPP
jgi:hypothetical protein